MNVKSIHWFCYNKADKLLETHFFRRIFVFPEHCPNLISNSGTVVWLRVQKLVSVSWNQPFQGMSGEHHFGVIAQKFLLYRGRVSSHPFDQWGLVDVVMLNFRSFHFQACLENENGSLPVGAAYLGHLTVGKFMFVLHKELVCYKRIQFASWFKKVVLLADRGQCVFTIILNCQPIFSGNMKRICNQGRNLNCLCEIRLR